MSSRDDAAGDVPDTFPTEWASTSTSRLEGVVDAAMPAAREYHHGGRDDWRDQVIVYRREEPTGEWPPWGSTTIMRIYDITPDELRLIAQDHRAAAMRLLEDIDVLESTADALDEGGDLGRRLASEMAGLQDQAARRKSEWDARLETARGPGGVSSWDAIDDKTQWALERAGLLTVAEVREQLDAGRLHQVEGIGAARLSRIMKALRDHPGEP